MGARETRMIREVVSISRVGTRTTILLKCGHTVEPSKDRGPVKIKRARCNECKPALCGATHRDGLRTCTLENRHLGLHDGGMGRGWNYDARQLDPVPA